jgi:hypothetical protein
VSPAGDGFDGQLLVFDPPEVKEFTWGPDRLRIELREDGTGTVLTLTDTFGELGKAARDGAGWHECLVCLERLAADLASARPGRGASAGARSTRATWPTSAPMPPASALSA